MTMLASAHSSDAVFYLGTYTNDSSSKGIYRGTINTETGELGPVVLAAEATSPSFVTVSPDGKFLYAALEGAGEGSIGAFADTGDGTFKLLNTQPSGGSGACHVVTDTKGRNVLAANYGGGNVACFPLRPDGSLGPRTELKQFSGSGPNPRRQTKSFAHAIYTDANDRFAYACDLGSDKVWTFRFDPKTGTLTPTDPPSESVPPGGGPRHLAFHPNGRFAYANNEMGRSVTAFQIDSDNGQLSAFQTTSTSLKGDGPVEKISTAEIACHSSGRWLYVSSRGDDIIAVYSIGEDGRLALIENAPAGVKVPRGMAIDPTGRWVVVAGQDDGKITVHRIDGKTGRLSLTNQFAEVGKPVSVIFATK